MSEIGTEAFTDGGGHSATFLEQSKWVVGTILDVSEKQEKAFGTKELKVWPDGKPKMQMVVSIQTEERDPTLADDDGVRVVYCKFGQTRAIGDAIKETGYQGPMVGGKLGLCWSGDEDTGKGNPLKLWKAKFEPPAETGAFMGEPPDDLSDPF